LKLLSLEMSVATGTVALSVGSVLAEREIASPREQTVRILPIIDELLGDAALQISELDGIVFGRGPGSFTGLRVAAAVAQGLALTTGCALLPVSSLLGLAHRAWQEHGVERALIAVDARMGEVYSALYRVAAGFVGLEWAENIGDPGAVGLPDSPGWWAVGDGFAAYPEALAEQSGVAAGRLDSLQPRARDLLPDAKRMLAAGQAVPVADALPVYLRAANAWKRA
jgi:tRNA threonylcarbamoyladenosine biosynthesis protein TsaB